MTEYLFAYGTLRPGLAPPQVAPLVQQFRPAGGGSVRGRLYDFGAYPGVVLDEAAGLVRGEVFALPDPADALLAAFDAYESCGPENDGTGLFRRCRATVRRDDGDDVPCWIYVFNRNLPVTAHLVPSGAWRR